MFRARNPLLALWNLLFSFPFAILHSLLSKGPFFWLNKEKGHFKCKN